jgi:hypothetical protein
MPLRTFTTFSLLILLPIDTGEFHITAIVHDADVNMGVQYLFDILISFSSDICSVVGLVKCIAVLFLFF